MIRWQRFRQKTEFLRRDKNLRRTLLNSGWLLGSNFVTSILHFIQVLIVTHALGAEQYGYLVLITTFVLAVEQLIDSRLWEAVIKFIPIYSEKGDSARAVAALKLFYIIDGMAGIVTWLILIFTADLAALIFLKNPDAAILIRVYALLVIIDFSTETSSALLRVNDRFKWLSYQGVAQVVFKIIGTIFVWALGATVERMLIMMLITSLLGVLLLQIMAYFAMRSMNLTAWSTSPIRLLHGEFKSILVFIFYSNLSATSRLVTSKVDILILGLFANPITTGFYDLAKRLVGQMQALITPIYTAVYPEISRLIAQEKYGDARALQGRLSKLVLGVVLVLCIGFTIAVIWVIPFFFGIEFAPAVPVAQVMVWSLIWTPLLWVPGMLLALGLSRLQAALVWFDAIVYIVLLFVGINLWGGMGAAIATLGRYIVWTITAYAITIHVYDTTWQMRYAATQG